MRNVILTPEQHDLFQKLAAERAALREQLASFREAEAFFLASVGNDCIFSYEGISLGRISAPKTRKTPDLQKIKVTYPSIYEWSLKEQKVKEDIKYFDD